MSSNDLNNPNTSASNTESSSSSSSFCLVAGEKGAASFSFCLFFCFSISFNAGGAPLFEMIDLAGVSSFVSPLTDAALGGG
jgi:hypothetical protein